MVTPNGDFLSFWWRGKQNIGHASLLRAFEFLIKTLRPFLSITFSYIFQFLRFTHVCLFPILRIPHFCLFPFLRIPISAYFLFLDFLLHRITILRISQRIVGANLWSSTVLYTAQFQLLQLPPSHAITNQT